MQNVRTGYEISLEDFRRLVSEPYSQPSVSPLLREWFQCEITGRGAGTVLRGADGRVFDASEMHQRIQADPDRQQTIYRVAMTLWR